MKVKGLKWQKWELEDWNEKDWKLDGQFCIFAKKKYIGVKFKFTLTLGTTFCLSRPETLDNLLLVPYNILTRLFKKLTKYKNDY